MNLTAISIVSYLLAIASAVWVNMDVKKWKDAGARVETSPTTWCIGVLLLWIIFFPLYLISRAKYKKSIKHPMEEQNKNAESSEQENSPQKSPIKGIVIGVIAFAVIFGIIAIVGSSGSNSGGSTPSVPSGCGNPNLQQQAQAVDYKQLEKDPGSFNGTLAEFTGQILQIQQSNGQGVMRLAVDKILGSVWNPSDVVYVSYQGDTNAVQDDVVNVYGPLTGSQTYTSQANFQITVPSMMGCVIEEASSSSPTAVAPSPTPVAPAQTQKQNPPPTQQPTVNQVTPSPAPQVSPPTPKTWHTETTYSNNADTQTAPFAMQGSEWRITYSCSPSDSSISSNAFYGDIDSTGSNGNSETFALGVTCPKTNTSYFYSESPGQYYLDLKDVNASYNVTVEDYY